MLPNVDGTSFASQNTCVTDRLGKGGRYAIDPHKLETEPGWKLEETFNTGIHKTVDWYLETTQWVSNLQSRACREWMNNQYV